MLRNEMLINKFICSITEIQHYNYHQNLGTEFDMILNDKVFHVQFCYKIVILDS